MALLIRDKRTDAAVRKLARLKGKNLTETVRDAVEKELARAEQTTPFADRIKALQQRYAQYPDTGEKADKAFFDELGGDL